MLALPQELLRNLLEKYGEEDQLLQTSGECGELVAVIQNYLRAKKYGRRTETMKDVIEEAVDVFFMVQQIREMDPALFDYIASQKAVAVIQKARVGKIK